MMCRQALVLIALLTVALDGLADFSGTLYSLVFGSLVCPTGAGMFALVCVLEFARPEVPHVQRDPLGRGHLIGSLVRWGEVAAIGLLTVFVVAAGHRPLPGVGVVFMGAGALLMLDVVLAPWVRAQGQDVDKWSS